MAKPEKKKEVKREAPVAKAGRRSHGGGKNADKGGVVIDTSLQAVILTPDEFVKDGIWTGQQLDLEGTIYEFNGSGLVLISSTDAGMTKLVNVHRDVFVPIWTLLKEEFPEGKLFGRRREKQEALWNHIVFKLTDEQLNLLEARLNSTSNFDETSVESKKPAFEMVVANPDIWERASANPKIAFDGMGLGDQSPAEIRIFEENYGIVLGVFFGGHHNRTDGFTLRVGYVGDKAELAGKIRVGTALFCHHGRLPDSLSEMQVSSPFGESLQALFNFLFELDHKVKGPFMNEMYHAFGRLNSMRKELAMKKAPKQQPAATVPVVKTEVTPVIEVKDKEPSHAGKVVQLSVVKTEVVAPTSMQPSLKEIMQELLKGGVDAVTIAEAVMAYKQATTEPVTNAEQNAV